MEDQDLQTTIYKGDLNKFFHAYKPYASIDAEKVVSVKKNSP